MEFDVTTILAVIGSVTGVSALGWDFYKWKYAERVRLRVFASPGYAKTDQPGRDYLHISVTNIGRVPTKINLISFHGYNSKWEMRKKNGKKVAILANPEYGTLPVFLNPGEDWVGGVANSPENFGQFSQFKYLVVQIEDTMSNRRFRAIIDIDRMHQTPKELS